MKAILDFLRKVGILQVSSGDYQTGEFDSGPEKAPEQAPVVEETPAEEATEEVADASESMDDEDTL